MATTGGGSPQCSDGTVPDYWWLPGKWRYVQLPKPADLSPIFCSVTVLDPDSSTVALALALPISLEDFIIVLCKALAQT